MYIALEILELVFYNVPENLIFKHIVAMGQHVAQSDDFIYIGDVIGQGRMIPAEANQRLADNLKFALNDKLQPTVRLKIINVVGSRVFALRQTLPIDQDIT